MNGWTNSATWTVNLYLMQTQYTALAARAEVVRIYQREYVDAVAAPLFPDRGSDVIVSNAVQIARSVASDHLGNWTRENMDAYADVENIPGVAPHPYSHNRAFTVSAHKAYADTFRSIAASAISAMLDGCNWNEIVRTILDADRENCMNAARQIADCAEVPRAITWTDHAAHMVLNAAYLGYDATMLRASAEKIVHGLDGSQVMGGHVTDAAKRVRAAMKRRGVNVPMYYGATCHVDTNGVYIPTVYDRMVAERAASAEVQA